MIQHELLNELKLAASELANILFKSRRIRVVLAESCTAGLVASTLAQVPGISDVFCGSAVTYRDQTKSCWLDVSDDDLQESSAVSRPITDQMATGVLAKTPEASWSAAVTGHFGPNAPAELDGCVFVSIAQKESSGVTIRQSSQLALKAKHREQRQCEAAAQVLRILAKCISQHD